MEGGFVREKSWGDRKSCKLLSRRASIREFIVKLRGEESHYGSNRSVRIYFNSELNITRLWKLYNTSVPSLPVKFWLFNYIFQREFNIGFGSPAVNVCSLCCRLKNNIKSATTEEIKLVLRGQLAVHKKRAKCFHTMLQEECKTEETFWFDLQQVQPIGEAFYSRQLAFYAFCITDRSTRSPILYTWNETQAGRGSVEVASAVCDFLKKHLFKDSKSRLWLFADGCGGQNKNTESWPTYAINICHYALQQQQAYGDGS